MGEERVGNSTSKEELVFNIQLSVVFAEHIRLISRVLKSQHSVTLNEYCTLVFLDALQEKISSVQLAEYLMYKHNTLLFVLTSLEDEGFIYKETNHEDKRAMLVCITPQGHKKALALAAGIVEMMTSTFWRSLSVSDYLRPLRELEAQLDGMRGHSMSKVSLSRDTLGLTHALLFRGVRIMVETWTEVVRECSGLSFNECRTLLLLELYGRLSPSEISKRLHIARSGISLSLDCLLKAQLVESLTDTEDGRGKLCRCTAKGLNTSHELLHKLRRATIDAYKTYTNDAIVLLNAQHTHMYSDLYQIESMLKSIMAE